ncbi:MAG: diguanylate cyclase domain-containing protein [Vulcanimicrobiaceae bacterium]
MESRPESGDLVRALAVGLSDDLHLGVFLEGVARVLARRLRASAVEIFTLDGSGHKHERFGASSDRMRKRSSLHLALTSGGKDVGTLSLKRGMSRPFTSRERDMLEVCALYLATRIDNIQQRMRADNLTERAVLADVDALTQLASRRRFNETLDTEWHRAQRNSTALSLLMIDVDHFKAYNDEYGHLEGDACLRSVADALSSAARRPADTVARYGGEEFAIVLPATDLDGAFTLGRSILNHVNNLSIEHERSTLGRVSLSIGAASTHPQNGLNPLTLIRDADAALYRAKNAGRNRIVGGDIVLDAPAAELRIVSRNNFPPHRAQLIGREEDIVSIVETSGRVRVLTVIGTGGVGKTSVAIEAARRFADEYPDGIWFVDLAGINDKLGVTLAIALAVGIEMVPAQAPMDSLVSALGRLSLLLVLDNCEHVAAHVAQIVDEIIKAAPGINVIATSREPLAVIGESVFRLRTLDEKHAVELFRTRVRDDGGTELPTRDEEVIAEICRRLDGLPLAIELAAARVRVLPISRILAALDERFALLSPNKRNGISRQRTLRSLIDWSYNLLSEHEKALLRNLSVFHNGWTLESAEALMLALTAGSVDTSDTLESLVQKSLVITLRDNDTRFTLLESIRAYAAEKLVESHQEGNVRGAYALVMAESSERFEMALRGMPIADLHSTIAAEMDNVRAALRWCIGEGRRPEVAGKILGHLYAAWHIAAYIPDARAALSQSLAVAGDLATRERACLWLAEAEVALVLHEDGRALKALDRAVQLFADAGDRTRAHVDALRRRALALIYLERIDEASASLREALSLAQSLAQPLAILQCRYVEALLDLSSGNAVSAVRRYREALQIAAQLGDSGALVLGNLAEAEFASGDYDAAIRHGREVLREAERRRGAEALIVPRLNLAAYLLAVDHDNESAEHAGAALRDANALGLRYYATIAVLHLAMVAARCGEFEDAARLGGHVREMLLRGEITLERAESVEFQSLDVILRDALDVAQRKQLEGQGAAWDDAAAYECALMIERRHP